MTKEEQQRIDDLTSLCKEYEEVLSDELATKQYFELEKLPPLVQEAISLVVAKSPGFSNVGALTTVNFVFNHLVGQLRPVINDPAYSDDALTPNYYGILIAPSGSGKDSSYNALLKACRTALNLVEDTRMTEVVNKAKERALQIKRKDEPDATIEDLTMAEFQPFIKDPLSTILSGDSSRGGIATLLNKFQKESLGVPSIFMGEFGMDLKNGSTIQDIIKLLGSLYDMGVSTSPEFKTEEVKEAAIDGMFPNFLGHTSPKVVFGDPKVREALANLFHTMLARRCWFSMPTAVESIENNSVAKSVIENRSTASKRRETISHATAELDTKLAEAVRRMLVNSNNTILTFTDDAATLYTDYFGYCQTRAQLLEESSMQQVEVSGRAFKTGRIAAVWALIHSKNEIDLDTLKSAIYFAEYNSRYLDEFVALTSSKPYILLANALIKDPSNEVTLDAAIMNGYVTRVSSDFRELLEPINSHLRDKGIVLYDEEAKVFRYSPFKDAIEETKGGYKLSYTKVPGIPKDDRSKEGRLDNFETEKLNGSFKFLENIMSSDTIYNVFLYNDTVDEDGNITKRDRNQKNIRSETTLVSIDVDDSPVDIDVIHEYLSEFKHIVATTSDTSNRRKFRILLPINVALSGENPDLYRYVVKRLAADLLIKADPTCFNPAQPMYSYAGSEVLSTKEGNLYSVTAYITDFANGQEDEVPVLRTKSKTNAERKRRVDKILSNINQVFDYVISAPMGLGSYSLARAALHMLDEEFNKEEFRMVINYINSIWTSPMDEERIEATIINQYIDRFPD